MSETPQDRHNGEPQPNDPVLFSRGLAAIRTRARGGTPVGLDNEIGIPGEGRPGSEFIIRHGFSAVPIATLENPDRPQLPYEGAEVSASYPLGYTATARWEHPALEHDNTEYYPPGSTNEITLLATTEGGLAATGSTGRISEEFDLGTYNSVTSEINFWQDGTVTVMHIDDNPSEGKQFARQLSDEEVANVVFAVEAASPIE